MRYEARLLQLFRYSHRMLSRAFSYLFRRGCFSMHTRGNMIPYTTLSKTRCKSEFCYKRNEINDASIDDSSGRVMIDASDGVQIRERKGSFKLRLRAPLPHSATNLSPVKELVYVMFATSRDQKLLHQLALSGQLGESNVRLKPLM